MPRAWCSTADNHKRHSTSRGEASTGIAHPSPKSTLMLSKSGVTSRLIAHLRYHCNLSFKPDCHQMRWSCGTSKWGATMARAVLNMEPICNDLPDEILEHHVLPLLPLASLCRFRAVSKKWNDYIAHSHFAALHAIASPPEDFALINIRTSLSFNALRDWEILDVVNGKFFPLSQDFLAVVAQAKLGSMDGTQRVVVAADGGLVLIWYSMAESSPNHMLLVCNPLLKAVKVIPSLPGWVHAHHCDCVVMSTDRTSMAYEIVMFHPRVNHYQVECIDVFQSKTGTWTRVVNPVVPSQEYWREDARFVRFRSRLYRLYRRQTDGRRQSEMKPYLAEFDKTTGVGSIVPLQNSFHSAWIDFKFLELVVSQDRLFCVCKWGTSNHGYRFVEIFEIFPEEHYCKLVTRMPLYDLMWLHGKEMYNQAAEVMDVAIMDKYVDPVVATGSASSILVCSCLGRSMAYNLVGNSWWRYSDGNLLQQHMNSTESGRYLECRNLGLSLCQP